MQPVFNDEVQLEHLQGYLYSQQAIKNTATANPGSMFEYAIMELPSTIILDDLKASIIQCVLNRINGSIKIEKKHLQLFYKKTILQQKNNWKAELLQKLKPWFIDSYLTIIPPTDYYENMVHPEWSAADKKRFIQNGYEGTQIANKRLKEIAPASTYFIHLLQLLMGNTTTIYEFIVPKELKQHKDYPWHMNLYWGMEFDLYLIHNNDRFLALHLGHVIT